MDRTWARRPDPPTGYRCAGNLLVPLRLTQRRSAGTDSAPAAAPEGVGDLEAAGRRDQLLDAPRRAYREILGRLRGSVVGHDQVVRRLALAGLQQVMGASGQRMVLIGPSGVGKTTMVLALAKALELPSVRVDVSDLAETNWAGRNLSDAILDLERQADGDERRMRRAVVVLDEIDKLGVGGHERSSWSFRRGKQESVLGLLGGGDVSYGDTYDRRDRTWSAAEALVISAGVFDGLPPGEIIPTDLIEWGLMAEVVGRLGVILRLTPPGPEAVREILWRELVAVGAVYDSLGIDLTVTADALEALANLATGPAPILDIRSASRLLRSAAEEALLQVVEKPWTEVSRAELSAEDLNVPKAQRTRRHIGFR